MPLKLNIGLAKKIGLPDYGSLGASANLELELDSGAIGDPGRLQQQVRQLFDLAEAAVEYELDRRRPQSHQNGDQGRTTNNGQSHTTSNGRHRANGTQRTNGSAGPQSASSKRSTGRGATQSQIRAIHAIVNRQRLDLAEVLERRGLPGVETLDIQQASDLIAELNGQGAAAGGSR